MMIKRIINDDKNNQLVLYNKNIYLKFKFSNPIYNVKFCLFSKWSS